VDGLRLFGHPGIPSIDERTNEENWYDAVDHYRSATVFVHGFLKLHYTIKDFDERA